MTSSGNPWFCQTLSQKSWVMPLELTSFTVGANQARFAMAIDGHKDGIVSLAFWELCDEICGGDLPWVGWDPVQQEFATGLSEKDLVQLHPSQPLT